MSTENDNKAPDFLNMSDEEILNYNASSLDEVDTDEDDEQDPPAGEAEGAESGEEATEGEDDGEEDDDTDPAATGSDDGADPGDDDGENGAPAAADAPDGDDASDTGDGDDADSDEPGQGEDPKAEKNEKPGKEGEKDEAETSTDDAKAFYDRVTAPFKANGKNMQIKDPEDAVRLMQMGANYNKKMAGLKPGLKVLKLLENNELMSEDKISFLIDLNKRDPAAIAKLVKDSGIDPLDLNTDEDNGYKPKSYSVDDREIELDEVIGEIKDSDTYSKTIDLVSNRWDDDSKQTIANSPQLLKVIDEHMASGVYGLISQEVERERTLGRLNGLSDIEAYRRVGDTINERGGFNHLFEDAKPQPQQKTVTPAGKRTDPKLNEKRRAAGPPKKSAPKQSAQEFNPLALSDEEFAKQAQAHLM